MITRVTVGSNAYTSMDAIRKTSSDLAQLQAQLSSGKQIQRPSDDPTGTVSAIGLRSSLARNDQYSAAADDAKAWLDTSYSALGQVVDAIQQARTAVVKGLNSGTSDPATYNALAAQVDGIRGTLVGLANTSYNGRPVFGGTTSGGVAYAADGSYSGDDGTVTRVIGDGQTVQVNSTGADVFGSAGSDVFTLLSDISTALRTDPSALNGKLADLDSAVSRVTTAEVNQSGVAQQVQRAQTSQTANGTAMTTRLTSIENIDLAEMAIKVTTANTAYQAALQTTSSIRQLSLLDFLR